MSASNDPYQVLPAEPVAKTVDIAGWVVTVTAPPQVEAFELMDFDMEVITNRPGINTRATLRLRPL